MAPKQQQVGINLASWLLVRHCASSKTWTTRMFRQLQTCQYFGGTAVKLTMGSWKRFVLVQALGTILLAAFTPTATAGLMWCGSGQQEAGKELVRAAHCEDPDLSTLALAMLQEGF